MSASTGKIEENVLNNALSNVIGEEAVRNNEVASDHMSDIISKQRVRGIRHRRNKLVIEFDDPSLNTKSQFVKLDEVGLHKYYSDKNKMLLDFSLTVVYNDIVKRTICVALFAKTKFDFEGNRILTYTNGEDVILGRLHEWTNCVDKDFLVN